jgi:hypothetical protein
VRETKNWSRVRKQLQRIANGLNWSACVAWFNSLSLGFWTTQKGTSHVTAIERLNAELFLAKQQLRTLTDGVADAKKAAREAVGEFSPAEWLELAAELERQAKAKRKEIRELEDALELGADD